MRKFIRHTLLITMLLTSICDAIIGAWSDPGLFIGIVMGIFISWVGFNYKAIYEYLFGG
jgi:hypothetical protein